MSEILGVIANDFYVFALTALGMMLAYFCKRDKDKQDKEK